MSRGGIGALVLVVSLLAGLLAGCPEEEPSEPCAGPGDPVISLATRRSDALQDGGQVDVFPPPQGGVFTELDVTIESMGPSELLNLYVSVVTPAGESLAQVRYFGNSIPLYCTEDEVIVIDNLPVGFDAAYELEDLDGLAAVVTGTLETEAGLFETRYEVELLRTEY